MAEDNQNLEALTDGEKVIKILNTMSLVSFEYFSHINLKVNHFTTVKPGRNPLFVVVVAL